MSGAWLQRHGCTLFLTGRTQRGLPSEHWLDWLAKERGWAAVNYTFHKNELGQPALMVRGQKVYCSVSHAVGLTVIGVHHHSLIGVDVERINEVEDDAELFTTFFPSLAAQAPQSQGNNDFFLKHWTAREALLKARGTGFFDDNADLTLPDGAEAKSWIETSGSHRWRISQICLPDKG